MSEAVSLLLDLLRAARAEEYKRMVEEMGQKETERVLRFMEEEEREEAKVKTRKETTMKTATKKRRTARE